MKKIYLALLMVSSVTHAAPLSWPKEAIDAVRNAKTIKDITCGHTQSQAGSELCDFYKSEQDSKVNYKFEQLDDATVVITSGKVTAKVERTDNPTEFVFNGHHMDFTNFQHQAQIAYAIQAALTEKTSGLAFAHR